MQTQQFEFTNKEQVFYNKYIGNFATPKKLNRSKSNLPANLIETIEAGEVTSEAIKQAAQIVPIYTYKTCLTIHGNLPEIQMQRIGGYKNLIQNKNGSLEIRYSAIDYTAKKQIQKYIGYGSSKNWCSKENSTTGIYFEKIQRAETKPQALEILQSLKIEVDQFNVSGMKAKVFCAGYNIWGMYYLVLTVQPLTIDGNTLTIAAQLTGEAEADILARIEAKEQQDKEDDQRYKAAAAERTAKKEAAAQTVNQYPKQKIQPTPGAVYISPVILTNGNAGYRYYKVENKGSFGRFTVSSYIDTVTTFAPDKLKEYRGGKQLKSTDIVNETYRIN